MANLIYRAGLLLLQDEEHVSWTIPELMEWTNEAGPTIS